MSFYNSDSSLQERSGPPSNEPCAIEMQQWQPEKEYQLMTMSYIIADLSVRINQT